MNGLIIAAIVGYFLYKNSNKISNVATVTKQDIINATKNIYPPNLATNKTIVNAIANLSNDSPAAVVNMLNAGLNPDLILNRK